jgi:hypothetical protein
MSKKQNGTITGETKGQVTKKSGKGNSHGFVSEVSTYFTVKPGHEEDARAAASGINLGQLLAMVPDQPITSLDILLDPIKYQSTYGVFTV